MDFRAKIDSVEQLWRVWRRTDKPQNIQIFTSEQKKLPELLHVSDKFIDNRFDLLTLSSATVNMNISQVQRL